MSRQDKATTERHTRTLRELVKRPENKFCGDCKKNGALLSCIHETCSFGLHLWYRREMGILEYVRCFFTRAPELLLTELSGAVESLFAFDALAFIVVWAPTSPRLNPSILTPGRQSKWRCVAEVILN